MALCFGELQCDEARDGLFDVVGGPFELDSRIGSRIDAAVESSNAL
jgi:hypothetical protein